MSDDCNSFIYEFEDNSMNNKNIDDCKNDLSYVDNLYTEFKSCDKDNNGYNYKIPEIGGEYQNSNKVTTFSSNKMKSETFNNKLENDMINHLHNNFNNKIIKEYSMLYDYEHTNVNECVIELKNNIKDYNEHEINAKDDSSELEKIE